MTGPLSWEIGEVRVTMVRESTVVMPLEVMFPAADRAALAAHADWLDGWLTDDRQLPQSVHTYVLESGGATILVDTCNGTRDVPAYPDMSNRPSNLVPDLTDAGFPPDSVDLVLCTHLHLDHVGWNTTLVDGAWVVPAPPSRCPTGAGGQDGQSIAIRRVAQRDDRSFRARRNLTDLNPPGWPSR